MASSVSSFLHEFPEHQKIIGRILTDYADLEVHMIELLIVALKSDIHLPVRILYRLKSEGHRLTVMDALARAPFDSLGLSGPYCDWVGAMRHCKKIRNQYAHSLWAINNNELAFFDLEQEAQKPLGPILIKFQPLTTELLDEQEQFFGYTDDLAWYLVREGRFRRDRRRKNKKKKPKALPPPSLHSPLS